MEIDSDLSQLLDSLSLDSQQRKAIFESEEQAAHYRTSPTPNTSDAAMSDSSDSEDSTYRPSPSQPSSSRSSENAPRACGCVYLQALHDRIQAGSYATTGGDYLEAIFTHREAFFAYPPGHRECAIGFSGLAQDLEARHLPEGWRADWDGDSEAAAAFRHEAWVIANAF